MKNNISSKSVFFSTNTLTRISLLIALNIILSRFLGVMLPIAYFPTVKISFSHIPIFISGILYGPFMGFICGFISDYLGSFIGNSGGGGLLGFRLLFSLSSGLTGMISGLIFKVTKNRDRNFRKMNTIFIVFVSICLCIAFYAKALLVSRNIFFVFLLFIITLISVFLPAVTKKSKLVKNSLPLFEKIYFIINVSRVITSIFINTYLLSILFGKSIVVFLPARIITNFIMIPLLAIGTTVIIHALNIKK